jgi:glycosyltransferase A (GT-A) superfamily protein (DUF2064 family)
MNPKLPVTLAVMAKAPIPGEAKTRLGATLGNAVAAELYRAFFLDTLAVLDQLALNLDAAWKVIVCPDERHAQQVSPIVGGGWSIVPQHRVGLMGGIVDAFEIGFAARAELVLVSDADSPLALYDHVPACLSLGSDHDVTLGPTLDGGYYLIAARAAAGRQLADLLLGVPYESSTICAATLARARSLGLTASLGPFGFDVDNHHDLNRLAARLLEFPEALVRQTRLVLREHAASPALVCLTENSPAARLTLAEGGD